MDKICDRGCAGSNNSVVRRDNDARVSFVPQTEPG